MVRSILGNRSKAERNDKGKIDYHPHFYLQTSELLQTKSELLISSDVIEDTFKSESGKFMSLSGLTFEALWVAEIISNPM